MPVVSAHPLTSPSQPQRGEALAPARLPLLQTVSRAPLSACVCRLQLGDRATRPLERLPTRAGSLPQGTHGSVGLRDTETSVWILALLLSDGVTSGTSLVLSRPPFSPMTGGEFLPQPWGGVGGGLCWVLTQHLGDSINICPCIHEAVLVTGRQLSQEDDGNLVTHHHMLSESRHLWHVAVKDVKCNCTNRRSASRPPSPKVPNVDTKLAVSRASHSMFLREEAGQSRRTFPEHLLGAGICTHTIPFLLGLDSEKWASSVPLQDEVLRAGVVLLRANLFSAEGTGEPRCACHLWRDAFPYLPLLGAQHSLCHRGTCPLGLPVFPLPVP